MFGKIERKLLSKGAGKEKGSERKHREYVKCQNVTTTLVDYIVWHCHTELIGFLVIVSVNVVVVVVASGILLATDTEIPRTCKKNLYTYSHTYKCHE